MTWNLSATWVVIQTLPLVLTEGFCLAYGHGFTLLGLHWLFGFIFQVVADNQKTKFKMNPANEGKFITEDFGANQDIQTILEKLFFGQSLQ